MRRLLLSLAIAASSLSAAYADDSEVACRIMGLDAGQAMEMRQSGKSPLDVIQALTLNKPKDSPYTKFVKTMVMEAFDRPRYTSTKYKRQAIQDFTAHYQALCLKSQ